MLKDALRVAEIFCSIQGEGPCIGVPAIFLRLSGCNFDCNWNVNGKVQHCDTRWARNEGKLMSIPEVVQEIYKIREQYPVSTLIVTGGEPTLQAEQLRILITILRDRNDITHIDIESNGTIPKYCVEQRKSMLSEWIGNFNHYIVSPKPQTKSKDLELLCRAAFPERFFFKFVCDDSKETNDWILKTIQPFINLMLPRENIFLMSAGTNAQELRERDKRTIEICKEANVRFSPRVHSYIWGLKKGV